MTFYVKRPGEHEGAPVDDKEMHDHVGTTDAYLDEWALYLPHQCDAWDIASGDLATTLTEAHAFRAQLDKAIEQLEKAQESDVTP